MYWETLPNWFWVLYYLFLLTTLVTAVFIVIRKKIRSLSMVAIVFTVTIPITGLINSIGRAEGINEYEHLISQLQQGEIWSMHIILGNLFLLLWWVLFLLKIKSKNQVIV